MNSQYECKCEYEFTLAVLSLQATISRLHFTVQFKLATGTETMPFILLDLSRII
jgi:hypothetical protein